MDESKKMILEKRIEKTMKALEKNKMKPFYAENRQQALELVRSFAAGTDGGVRRLGDIGRVWHFAAAAQWGLSFSGPLCARTDS